MIQNVTKLPINHPKKQEAIKLIQNRSCKTYQEYPDLVDKVYCCGGKKGIFPIECKLREIKDGKKTTAAVKGNHHHIISVTQCPTPCPQSILV